MTSIQIPSQAQVIGVTGRVLDAISGSVPDRLADRRHRIG